MDWFIIAVAGNKPKAANVFITARLVIFQENPT
jgi:hypothetical protein